MSKKRVMISGRCVCGKEMDVRIINPEKGEKVDLWVIHGFCSKCKKIFVQGIFTKKPEMERDYVINWGKKVKKEDNEGK